jgi:hypothetical protein
MTIKGPENFPAISGHIPRPLMPFVSQLSAKGPHPHFIQFFFQDMNQCLSINLISVVYNIYDNDISGKNLLPELLEKRNFG